MLTIRRAQLEELSRVRLEYFVQRVVAHLFEELPEECRDLGAEELSEAVRDGVARARSYEIEGERGLMRWAELMVRYGREFDADPELPFADRILQERMVHERQPSIDALFELAEDGLRGQGPRHLPAKEEA